MISYWQAAILGLLQGISELFPISSLGHSVILPKLLGWHIAQSDPFFVTFLVATHFATAIVLFGFFWKDWLRILNGVLRSLKEREIKRNDPDAMLGWLLIGGTIPAGILGLLFEDALRSFFAAAVFAAFFLFLNGFILLGGEMLRRRKKIDHTEDSDKRIAKINWWQAFVIGSAQAIALFPGFSRTGATLVGGLLAGLSHEDAVRFSFLLATPIIAAAAILKLPDLVSSSGQLFLIPSLIGAVCAGITAYFSVKFLTAYFHTKKLTPFGIYCIVAGGLSFVYLLLR